MSSARIGIAVMAGFLAGQAFAADPTGWDLLNSVEINEVETDTEWRAEKTFPPALRAATSGFMIEGFYVPIEPQGYVQNFLLIRDPDECPFCGTGGGYGPSLEVSMKRPMQDLPPYAPVTLKGELELIDDPDTYMAFRLTDARLISN